MLESVNICAHLKSAVKLFDSLGLKKAMEFWQYVLCEYGSCDSFGDAEGILFIFCLYSTVTPSRNSGPIFPKKYAVTGNSKGCFLQSFLYDDIIKNHSIFWVFVKKNLTFCTTRSV